MVRPSYKVVYRTVTSLEWKCCPGFSGAACEEGEWRQRTQTHFSYTTADGNESNKIAILHWKMIASLTRVSTPPLPRHSRASSFLFMSLWLVTIHVPLFCIAVLKPAFPICLYEWFPLGLHKATSVLWMKLRNKIPQHPTTLLITFYVFIPRVAAPVRLPSLLRLWILFCRLNWVFYPQKSYASAVYIFRPR